MIEKKNLIVTKENKTIEDIYVEAGVLHKLFLDKTPVDLYRYVDDEGPTGRMTMYPVLEPEPRPDGRVRNSDVERGQINGVWYVYPKIRKGLSTFNARVPFPRPGKFYMIPKGTQLPSGLAVGEDNPHRVWKAVHYSILPRMVMAEEHFLFLLRRLAAHAIPCSS